MPSLNLRYSRCSLDDDLESPLYASPTVYGWVAHSKCIAVVIKDVISLLHLMILQVCQDRWEAVSGLQESGKKRFLSYQLTSLLINQQRKQISPAFGISHKPATLNLILFAIKVIIDSFLQGDSTLASISQPADEFTFGHTGHMAIILGRYDFTNIITILCIWPPYLTFTLLVQIRCFVLCINVTSLIVDVWSSTV